MHLTHLYSGSDGQSHFERIELNLQPERRGQGVELLAAVQGILIRQLPSGFALDYHVAPRRQIVLQLAGRGEITCGDGTSQVFGPGDILLADDLTGQGHRSREIEGPRQQLIIYLDPGLDLSDIGSPGAAGGPS